MIPELYNFESHPTFLHVLDGPALVADARLNLHSPLLPCLPSALPSRYQFLLRPPLYMHQAAAARRLRAKPAAAPPVLQRRHFRGDGSQAAI